MTPRRRDVFGFIEHQIDSGADVPTFSEIARGLGLSVSTVNGHLKALAAAGVISLTRRKARSIRILKPSSESVLLLLHDVLPVISAAGDSDLARRVEVAIHSRTEAE